MRCCCIRWRGTVILLAILFLMFQAVFSWATPAMDLIDAGFTSLGQFVVAGAAGRAAAQLHRRRH